MKTKPVAYVVFYEERGWDRWEDKVARWKKESYVTQDRRYAQRFRKSLLNRPEGLMVRNVSEVLPLFLKEKI
jgi:hypothetical protein